MSENNLIEKSLEKMLPRFSEIFTSANINFYLGPVFQSHTLSSLIILKMRLMKQNRYRKAEKYKEYFAKVMLPNLNIASNDFTKKNVLNGM